MKQYLDQKLIKYSRQDIYPFHMPGHKRQPLGGCPPEEIDITEIDGFDNLHQAEGILREAQERMANVFGAARSFFLVNGSTAGILAAVCASVSRGGCILAARNCHRSVAHAIGLMELRPVWICPQQTDAGIAGSISPGKVRELLEKYPCEAVILTSPTYEGVVSDIGAIARIAGEKGIPLIVDEAHGAHFGFSDGFPQKAVRLGADLCVESLHKTLPAYTQTAALHVKAGARVDMEKLQYYLQVFQSSSPSYVLMSGIDRCTRILEEQGKALFAAFSARLTDFYEKCRSLRRVQVFCKKSGKGIWERDPSRILLCASAAGLSGRQLYDLLLRRFGLQLEMADGHYALAIATIMDTDDGFARLADALAVIDAQAQQEDVRPAQPWPIPAAFSLPQKGMEIREAVEAAKEEVWIKDAAGRIAGELLCPYPPGIPLAVPGEILTEETVAFVCRCLEQGIPVQGVRRKKTRVIFTIPA